MKIKYNPINIFKIGIHGLNTHIGRGLNVKSGKGIQIGDNVRIGRFGRLSCFSIGGKLGNIIIENGCYIGDFFSALSGSDITIKHDTLIASYCTITSENHSVDPECGVRYGNQPLLGKPVTIGNNCWIGEKVMILPGVTIGEWSIIGAASVVTKDIPNYSIAVGNPAKVIKTYNFKSHRWEIVQ